jgi:multidrug efflux system membrane fusion protein
MRSLLSLLVACSILSWGCAAKKQPRNQRVPVTTARVERRDMPFSLTASGSVEAIRNASVQAQVGGVVTRVAFHEGETVRTGQVLVELDPRPFRQSLNQAQAALARDRALAEAARRELQRSRVLFDQNVLSQTEWDQKNSDAEATAATVRADSAAVNNARLSLQNATIRAPIAGKTGRLTVHVGDTVRPTSDEPLVTIIQPAPIRVAFKIPEGDVPVLQRYRQTSTQVWVVPDSARASIPGRLVFVDNSIDAASGTLLLKGEFPNRDQGLVPGQFVDVRLVLYVTPQATVVPSQAVSTGQQGAYVYVVNPDSTVTTRVIDVERTVEEMTVVARGLKAGETVVTDGQIRLSPGAKVQIRKPGGGKA